MKTLLPILLSLALTACPSDTSGEDAATVEEICDTLFAVCEDGWGWPSVDECYAGFVGNPDYGTTCTDEAGYLSCMSACLDSADCDAFSACEPDCWDGSCM